jgi:hypothetical protein
VNKKLQLLDLELLRDEKRKIKKSFCTHILKILIFNKVEINKKRNGDFENEFIEKQKTGLLTSSN